MEREKEIENQPEYAPSSPVWSFMVSKAPSLLSWNDEELKKRIDLDERLLGIITDGYNRSELYGSLSMYYFTLGDFEKFYENLEKFRELRKNEKDFAVIYM